MKQPPTSIYWLLALIVAVALYSIFLVSASLSVVSFKDGVDKDEGDRIFRIAKPIIDERFNGNPQETRYYVSRFEGNWVIEVFERRFEFVPGGQFLFVFDSNGDLIHYGGGV